MLATHLTRSEEKHCCGCVMAMNTKVYFVQALSVKLCAGVVAMKNIRNQQHHLDKLILKLNILKEFVLCLLDFIYVL